MAEAEKMKNFFFWEKSALCISFHVIFSFPVIMQK